MTHHQGDTHVICKAQALSTAATPWPAAVLSGAGATPASPLRAQGTGARSTSRLLTVFFAAFLLLALVVPALASARVPSRALKETFGSIAQPTFTNPSGMTVDQATGDVYVIELGEYGEGGTLRRYKENGEPDKFSALSGNAIDGHAGEADEVPGIEEILSTEGSYIEAEVAVAPSSAGASAGDIYVTDAFHQVIDIFAPTGAYLGQKSFGYPCGVAVDASGTVFVGSLEGEEAVYKLKATTPGNLTEVTQFPTAAPCQVVAGYGPTAGSIFVARWGGKTTKLNAETGSTEAEVFSGQTLMLSTDPVTGHLYLVTGKELNEFDVSSASPQELSSTTLPSGVHGVAANGTNGNVYADREGDSKLEVFGGVVERTLTVTLTGSGKVSETAGSVEPISGTIEDCTSTGGAACTATYLAGDEPEFEAVAEPGNHLVGWTSVQHAESTTCTGALTPCKIKLKSGSGAENVTAAVEFAPGSQLTIEKGGAGAGTVTSVQSGLGLETIGCGTHCSELFTTSAVVELAATPQTGSEFTGWSTIEGDPGTCTGTVSPCEVTMSEAVKLDAAFALQSETLTVDESGPGVVECEFAHSGTFGACTSPQSYGTTVNVKAAPNTGAFVESLTGTGSASTCTTSGCEFTMTEASSVTVAFAVIANPSTLTVFKGGNGSGTVTSLAPHTGITCGTSCEEASAIYEETQTIELQATAAPGSVFAGWIGCRRVTATTCQVKLGSPEVEATAVFLLEGKEGPTGPEGPAGKEGATGKEGPTGTTGKEGSTGAAGKEGPAGKEGKQGASGAQGTPGATGAQGEHGAQGVQGTAGPVGPVGPAGPVGAQGPKGETGAPGKVTCTVKQHGKKVKVTCTIKYASAKATASAARRSLHWVLVRDRKVLAHGKSKHKPRINLGALHRGLYTLYLQGQSKGTVIHVH